jgi:hypothetical protein
VLVLVTFQGALHDLVARTREIDIRRFEIASAERIAAELQPVTLRLLADAKALLAEVLACAKADGPAEGNGWSSYLPFEKEIDSAVAIKLGSRNAIDEIAFIAQLELRQREERLARITAGQGVLVLLGECDSSLRRVRKALDAVDAAIAKAEGVPPRLDFTSELERSLAVRRAYAKFVARILGDGAPTVDTLRARFRAAGTQIAVLVGRDVYPELRVADRLLLRELQMRILDWLRGGPEATAEAGLRLWQDLACCLEMFSLVSRRQELVAHDRAILRQVAGRELDPGAWDALRGLEGLDPQLDAVLRGGPCAGGDDVIEVIDRLATQLGLGDYRCRRVPVPGW